METAKEKFDEEIRKQIQTKRGKSTKLMIPEQYTKLIEVKAAKVKKTKKTSMDYRRLQMLLSR